MDRKKKLTEFLNTIRQNNAITRNNKRDLEETVKKLYNPRIAEETVDTILYSFRCLYNLDEPKRKEKKTEPKKPGLDINTYESHKQNALRFCQGLVYSTCFTQGGEEKEKILLTEIKTYEN